MTDLAPLEPLYDAAPGNALYLPPELAALYGRLVFPEHPGRPYVIANFVETLDGVVSLGVPGQAGGGEISGFNPHDRMVMGLLRAVSDAVIVGAGTLRAAPPGHIWTADYIFPALADAYQELRASLGKDNPPLNVIVTSSGKVDVALPVFQTGKAPVLIVTTPAGAQHIPHQALPTWVRVRIAPASDGRLIGAREVLDAVNRTRASVVILVEGGPRLMGNFLAEHCLDEQFLTLSPQVAGRDDSRRRPGLVMGHIFAPDCPLWATLVGVKRGGSHLFLRYMLEMNESDGFLPEMVAGREIAASPAVPAGRGNHDMRIGSQARGADRQETQQESKGENTHFATTAVQQEGDTTWHFDQAVQGSDVYNPINTACRTAITKRTAAHINFAINRQMADAQDDFYQTMGGPPKTPNQLVQPPVGFYGPHTHLPPVAPVPAPELLQKAADVLNSGTKVAIVAGHGALGAGDALEQMANLLAAPIIKPLLGKGVVPDDSPFTTGGVGLLGTRPSQEALEQCDTLLMVGTSFPYVAYLPKPSQARGVQIDIDETRLGLRFPVEVGLVGDALATVTALLPLLRRKSNRAFLEKAQQGMKGWNTLIDAEGTNSDVPMRPEVVAHTLEKLAASDAIICGDSGTNTAWIARNFRLKRGQMFSLSGNLATMASGLPYSIGAQVAYPNRQVIAFVGDGGFTMLMGEMLTAVKYRLPIKVIIIKNNVLGQIKWEQIVFLGNPQFGVELQPADFAGWARAAGAEGFCAQEPDKIEDVMRQFLAASGPAVLEAVVNPNEPPLPPKVTPEQTLHFAEALVQGQPQGGRIALTAFRDKIEQWTT